MEVIRFDDRDLRIDEVRIRTYPFGWECDRELLT